MTTERLTQCARNVLDAWSDAGWNVGFDAAMRAMREELAAHEAPAAVPVEPRQITEAMHVAACKVLTRASGLDGTPQRMLDAMLAAAPQPQQTGVAPASLLIDAAALLGSFVEDDVPIRRGEARDLLKRLRAAKFSAATPPQPTAPQQAAPEPGERGLLRALQATTVMPMIGPLLDAWENADREVMEEEPELAKWLSKINKAMEAAGDDDPASEQPAPQAQAVSQWLPIESAPEGVLVVVCWLDTEDSEHPERHDLDYLDEGSWAKHRDHYEHVCAIGGWGVSETPPYTGWLPLPPVTAVASAAQKEPTHE